jgi:hypothetical protein
MARKRTKLAISQEELCKLRQQIRSTSDPRDKERMHVVVWATSGQHTLDDMAR